MPSIATQKGHFYHRLGTLLQSGQSLRVALDHLAADAHPVLRTPLSRVCAALDRGRAAAASFREGAPAFSPLEIAILDAGERCGRLAPACTYLAQSFRLEAETRRTILRQSAYPLLLIHLATLLTTLPHGLLGGWRNALVSAAVTLGALYLIALLIWLGFRTLRSAAASNPAADALLSRLPLLGTWHRHAALSRFLSTLDLTLDAGINVMDATALAASAARSARLADAAAGAIPSLRQGHPISESLALDPSFPPRLAGHLRAAEGSGTLATELPRLAREHHETALSAIATLTEWAPRLIYFAAILYAAFQIISLYSKVLDTYLKLLDF